MLSVGVYSPVRTSAGIRLGKCISWSEPRYVSYYSTQADTSLEETYLPVVVERPAPNCKVQYEHNHVSHCNIYCRRFHDVGLVQILRQSPIQEQEARLASPLHSTHALFNKQDGLRAPCSLLHLLRCEIDGVCRVDEIGGHCSVDIEEDNEDYVQALETCVSQVARALQLWDSYCQEEHPIFCQSLRSLLER